MTLGREIIKLSWVGSEEVGHTAEKRKLGFLQWPPLQVGVGHPCFHKCWFLAQRNAIELEERVTKGETETPR